MFTSVLKVGMLTQKCLSDIALLQRDIAMWIMIHNINEQFKTAQQEKNGKAYAKSLIEEIEPKVKLINKLIGDLNRVATLLGSKQKIRRIEWDRIKKEINNRFSFIAENGYTEISNENFNLKLQEILSLTQKSVEGYINAHEHAVLVPEISKIKTKKLAGGLKDALDIGSMGVHQIAIFTVGRVIEQLVNNYIRVLIKNKKLARMKLADVKLDTKIGILKKHGLISDKMFHELTSIKISRNDTGHPLGGSYSRAQVIGSVNQAVLIVKYVEKKMERFR